MPYIDKDDRIALDNVLDPLSEQLEKLGFKAGNLNYCIYKLLLFYFKNNAGYEMVARVSGVLQNVSDEFYRKWVVPYEEKKIAENGDIS